MSKQAEYLSGISSYRPVAWEQIPDLGLYMDQVVTFLERQCKGLYTEGERVFTPAMVNNYVKLGLVSRPNGKKYGREQLAQLLMICMLKQAASAEGMKRLLMPREDSDLEAHYGQFCQMVTDVTRQLCDEKPLPSPLACAVRCSAFRFLCNAVLAKQDVEEQEETEA